MSKTKKLHSFDIKVEGYETVQAENADAAFEAFDKLLEKGYSISDLRWKSITATLLDEGNPVSPPHGSSNTPVATEKLPKKADRSPRIPFFASPTERMMFRRRVGRLSIEDVIICVLANAQRPATKSALLSFVDGLRWEGFASRSYVYYTKRVREAFNTLVACGAITWEPRKSVQIVEEK